MKNLEWLKLVVLLTCIAFLVGMISYGPGMSAEVVSAFQVAYSGETGFSDGLSAGLFSLLYKFFVFFLYAVAIALSLLLVVLVLSIFGIVSWLLQRLIAGLVYIRNLWRGSTAGSDLVIAKTTDGKDVSLIDLLEDLTKRLIHIEKANFTIATASDGEAVPLKRFLKDFSDRLLSAEGQVLTSAEKIAYLEHLTQGLEPPAPPPPPKTPEEIIAELQAQLAAQAAEAEALRAVQAQMFPQT